ncbi:MAG: thiol:disulfide interchange protein DsbA/DsbL [Ectothiorhodospiraceae bacterium]|nr:thiol:disulfide interchange protein DsbA/DsbL [Ectothiorhodospiraceae bacterium]
MMLALGAGTLATALALSAPATAQQSGDSLDGRYQVVQPPQPTEVDAGKVEVVDVFWYGCPHCFRFLPEMERYEASKPDYVVLRRMPAVFRDSWRAHARAYYTAELLGVVAKIHRPLFEAIHEKRQALDTRESLMEFFAGHGVSKEDFAKTFDSFAVESLVRKSEVMQARYGVQGTPSVIVNGKYRVVGNLAGSYENMARITAALAEREHQQ